MLSKNQSFYFGAGKIILAIDSSMVLASYGPGEKFNNAEKLSLKNTNNPLPQAEFENAVFAKTKTILESWEKPLRTCYFIGLRLENRNCHY
jgi:hypothetical protein